MFLDLFVSLSILVFLLKYFFSILDRLDRVLYQLRAIAPINGGQNRLLLFYLKFKTIPVSV